jgi:hypothetical protein
LLPGVGLQICKAGGTMGSAGIANPPWDKKVEATRVELLAMNAKCLPGIRVSVE